MAKKKTKSSETAPKFEEALQELQQIVADLEEGAIGLEESMQRFEQGVALLRVCYQALEQAEQKIEILTGLDADGNPVATAFDGSATADTTAPAAGRRKQAYKRSSGQGSTAAERDVGDTGGTLFS